MKNASYYFSKNNLLERFDTLIKDFQKYRDINQYSLFWQLYLPYAHTNKWAITSQMIFTRTDAKPKHE